MRYHKGMKAMTAMNVMVFIGWRVLAWNMFHGRLLRGHAARKVLAKGH